MNAQDFASAFLTSSQGAGAASALAAQGINTNDVQTLLGHAAEAGHAHVEEHGAGLLGEHPVKSFFAAFASGIVKGDGFLGSIGDGFEGALVGRVAEALASRVGLDPSTASTVAAAATPYVVDFIKKKLAG